MPPLVKESKTAKDKPKKTKSRNGCARCKEKRLKCDETAPACLQCKKRNVQCPGYEKMLKWSTKYEMFQPLQMQSVETYRPADMATTPTGPMPGINELPPDVVNGFQALAAVLPVGKKRPEQSQSPQLAIANQGTPPNNLDEQAPIHQGDSPDSNVTFNDSELLFDDVIDPALLQDGFVDFESPNQDYFPDHMNELDFNLEEPLNLDNVDLDFDLEIEELPQVLEPLPSMEVASPRLSRSLLLDYYRLPNPSPSPSLDDMESILIQHYFKDVCVLFSSFDSSLNPFRTAIGRLFQDSASIYYAIQSMAAAHLANTFPTMAAVGIDMQRKACDSLQAELPLVQSGEATGGRTFLSIILLGLTTCWHESGALGEPFLAAARSLILPKLLTNAEDEVSQRQNQFFEESLIYWEMLMGFVTQDAMTFSPGPTVRKRVSKNAVPAARKPDGKIVPHPWTGIAPTVQYLFAEVGRLVSRERNLGNSESNDLKCRFENLANAATLEEDLLAAEYPMADELDDPGDERTSKHDFIVIAEAYRCCGLLELYRVFPSIMRKRLGTDSFTWADNVEFEFPTPRYETPYEDTDTKLWINALALHILKELEKLPSSSGTCCLQPILLVAAASELKFVSSVDYFDICANDTKVRRARDFVDRRLHEYALKLPAKPLRKMIELVKEVWRRLDEGENAFWIDVMVEKKWYTVMG
ncbi:hypothetical protein EJ04DRAFT_459266 [Polyplosphaeria fusca]|uniref:Zn(2)-C6 fungal-type domain-containing protein n=1 Tax=Polyplosphaeria fusca TaxID=682080 RepID=A0A9P4V3C5_9PLEO|nr:hypothetical protein EJ04DRAFT_459266 [Polyplosphaeria fusca]